MTSVLYLTRNGLMEPLGQSQILSYMSHCSSFCDVTIVSHEKDEDLKNNHLCREIAQFCEKQNIRWIRLRLSRWPKFISPFMSLAQMFIIALQFYRKSNGGIIHARSLFPALVAFMVHSLFGIRFVYDTRGLWLEELVVSDRLTRGSFTYKLLYFLEKKILKASLKNIVLTHAVIPEYLNMDSKLKQEDFVVIPTCCDTKRFSPADKKQGPAIISCVGTMLSAWFDLSLLKQVMEVSSEVFDDVRFEFITNDSEEKVRQALGLSFDLNEKTSFRSVSFSDIPAVIKRHDISLLLYTSTTKSEIARSPTRFAELMSSGVAVLATPGIGDLDTLIQEYNVGGILNSRCREKIHEIMTHLKFLITEKNFKNRCLNLADEIYQVRHGAEKILSIYSEQNYDY